MKIVHVTYPLSHGGIGTMLGQIANEQVKNNDVSIIVVSNIVAPDKINALDKKINVIFLNRKTGSQSPLPLIKLNYLLYTMNADIIHFHDGQIKRYLIPFVWCKIKKKSCVTLHTVYSNKASIKKACLNDFLLRFSISEKVSEILLDVAHLESVIVPNGINVNDFKHKMFTENILEPFKIIQIGRLLHKHKGQDILIQALSLLLEKGYSNWSVTFLGGVGDSQPYLQKLAQDLGVLDYIEFVEPKDHHYIEQHLCDFDLLIHPSRFEGFGLVVAEAMAAKVPVLVSNCEGPMEIIDNGKYGYYFENENIVDCAEKIEQIINSRKDKKIIDWAYQRILDEYDIKVTAQRYWDLYKKNLCKIEK